MVRACCVLDFEIETRFKYSPFRQSPAKTLRDALAFSHRCFIEALRGISVNLLFGCLMMFCTIRGVDLFPCVYHMIEKLHSTRGKMQETGYYPASKIAAVRYNHSGPFHRYHDLFSSIIVVIFLTDYSSTQERFASSDYVVKHRRMNCYATCFSCGHGIRDNISMGHGSQLSCFAQFQGKHRAPSQIHIHAPPVAIRNI